MGTYRVTINELLNSLEEFLRSQDGEVLAENLAEAYNQLAKENDWNDRLKAYETEASDE